MRFPDDISNLAHHGLLQMRQHPEHHFDWRTRRAMYRVMKNSYKRRGYIAHGWLATITASYVLPIFSASIVDDPIPQQLLSCAEQIMQKTVRRRSREVNVLIDDVGYYGTGTDWMDLRDVTAYNAEYAGFSVYKALIEANGAHDLLESTDAFLRGEAVGQLPNFRDIPPENATDYHIADSISYSDTASTAAIAASCAKERYELDPQKLALFWDWWVTIALPEAWKRV